MLVPTCCSSARDHISSIHDCDDINDCRRVDPQICLMQTVKQLQAVACLGHPFLSVHVTAAVLSASSLRHCLSSIFIRDWKGFKQRSGTGKPHGQFMGTSTEFESWAPVLSLKAGLQHSHTSDTVIAWRLQRSIRLHAMRYGQPLTGEASPW